MLRRCTKFRMNLLGDALFETSVDPLIYRVSIHYSPSRRCKVPDIFEVITSVDNLVPFGKVKIKNLISQRIIRIYSGSSLSNFHNTKCLEYFPSIFRFHISLVGRILREDFLFSRLRAPTR